MLKVNEYGGRQTKVNEKRQCFEGWETLVRNNSPKTNFAVINVILSSHLTHSSAVALHEMLKVTAT